MLAISATARGAYAIGKTGHIDWDAVLAMGRDSGRLEFDAATVICLIANREDSDEPAGHLTRGMVGVPKQRLGARGRVPVEFDGVTGLTRELEEDELPTEAKPGGEMTDAELEVVITSLVESQDLRTKKAIKDRVKARGQRVGDVITGMLASGRLVGGGKERFRAARRGNE